MGEGLRHWAAGTRPWRMHAGPLAPAVAGPIAVAMLVACSGAPPERPPDAEAGVLRVALAEVPGDVRCVTLTFRGAHTVARAFDVAPGSTEELLATGLPLGSVRISGEAHAAACAMLTGVPTWVSDPVEVTLVLGVVARVRLVFRRAGSAVVEVDFEEPDGGAGEAPDAAVEAPPAEAAPETPGEDAPPDTPVTPDGAPTPDVAPVACSSAADCPTINACIAGHCGPRCDASHPCNGGCCADGTCVSGRAPDACGTDGAACRSCGEGDACVCGACELAKLCTFHSECPPNLACGPRGRCGAACTDGCNGGCCTGTSCVAGTADGACGARGGLCRDCRNAAGGHACIEGKRCGCRSDGDCPAGRSCDVAAGVCQGCQEAADCPIGQACDPSTGLCSTTCAADRLCHQSCCQREGPAPWPATATGICVAGTTPTACGDGGGWCVDCPMRHPPDPFSGCLRSSCFDGRGCGCTTPSAPTSRLQCDLRAGACYSVRCGGPGFGPCPAGMCCRRSNPQDLGFCAPAGTVDSCNGFGDCVACNRPCARQSGVNPCSGTACVSNFHLGCGEFPCPDPATPDLSRYPVLVRPTLAGGTAPVKVALAGDATCALFANGTAQCWGAGWGSPTDTPATIAPVAVPRIDDVFAASRGGICFALAGGGFACSNQLQLGDPFEPALSSRAVQLANYNFARFSLLFETGAVVVGTGPDMRALAVGGHVRQLVAGGDHACALLDGGTVRCWGWGTSGALGYPGTNDLGDDESPAALGDVPLGGPVAALFAGFDRTCVTFAAGGHRCWGSPKPYPEDAPGAPTSEATLGGPVAQFAFGRAHTCVLLESGRVRCWGAAGKGQLGYASTATIGDDEPIGGGGDVELGGRARFLAAGADHTCAILAETGAIRCWGSGDLGQLGHGNGLAIGDDETPASAGDVPLRPR